LITVTIVDDHRLFADGLAEALNGVPDIRVVGVAYDGSDVARMLAERRPDVTIIDLEMPQVGGLDVLRSLSHQMNFIVVTMHADFEHREQAVAAGAAGFLSKSAPLVDLAAAIRAVSAGREINDPTTLRGILGEFAQPILDSGATLLTARERELLSLLGRGITTTDELADRLYISKKTVKNHLASIFEKLEVNDRAQAAIEAIRLGLAPRG